MGDASDYVAQLACVSVDSPLLIHWGGRICPKHLNPDSVTVWAAFKTTHTCIQTQGWYYSEVKLLLRMYHYETAGIGISVLLRCSLQDTNGCGWCCGDFLITGESIETQHTKLTSLSVPSSFSSCCMGTVRWWSWRPPTLLASWHSERPHSSLRLCSGWRGTSPNFCLRSASAQTHTTCVSIPHKKWCLQPV